MIRKVRLSDDYLRGEVVKKRTSKQFRTPTAVPLAPNGRLLVTNAEFFDGDGQEPFFVLSIPRP